MHRLKSTSRPLLSYVASAPPCWLRLQLMAISDPPIRHVSRFPRGSRNLASRIGVRGEEESGKPDSRRIISSTKDIMISLGEHSQRIKNVENSNTTKEFIASYSYGRPASGEDGRTTMDAICGDQEYHRKIVEVTDGKRKTWGKWDVVLVDTDSRETKVRRGEIMVGGDEENVSCTAEIHGCSVDRVVPLNILPDSSHRDGSIYRDTSGWKKDFRIVDRRETRLEAMMLSNPTDCVMDEEDGTCMWHRPRRMLQIFSLKLAKIPVYAGKIELYGYIATRDDLEPLLNYVVNVSRDDPIIVEQGSFINIAPKRGIKLGYDTLIEYDMKIKTGGHEKDDLQLIDGVSVIGIMGTPNWSVFTSRIIGSCGAIDISASRLDHAVEATVEVLVSEVQGSFSMCLGCFTSRLDKEIRLFDGTIGEPHGLKRYVVAVVMGTQMDLRFKVGAGSSRSSEHCCSFTAHNHGHVDQLIETDFALISLKVTWSVLPGGWSSDLMQALLKSWGD
ncbi:unnamed protein product [Urochloa decumbens]|uniref:DUF6598 domain-containing protein n=1 Tax=Urochloa decumbens TaxID=240449 RepID=A0ABC8VFN6_9POAL